MGLHTKMTPLLVYLLFQVIECLTELPKFSQLLLLYPGYPHSGGEYHDRELLEDIGASEPADLLPLLHPHNSAALRMSWALNRYSGRHAIGTRPVYLSNEGRDSITGQDGQQYIFRNTAFGPYLAEKYGNPTAIMLDPLHHEPNITKYFSNRQGILRFLSYHKDHAGGHIALWDCDHFHQSRDWSTEHHIISVEFWETPDSYCPPKPTGSTTVPELVTLKPGVHLKVIARHNFQSLQNRRNGRPKSGHPGKRHRAIQAAAREDDERKIKLRHIMDRKRARRLRHQDYLWAQQER